MASSFSLEMNGRVSKALSGSSDEDHLMNVLIDLFTEQCNLSPPKGNFDFY